MFKTNNKIVSIVMIKHSEFGNQENIRYKLLQGCENKLHYFHSNCLD